MKSKTILQIHSASTAIMAGLSLLFLITCGDLIVSLFFNADLFTIGYTADTAANIGKLVNRSLYYLFILAILAATFMMFRSIRRENTPFLPDVPKYIKIIGGLVMFASPVSRWIGDIVAFFVLESIVIVNDSDIIGIFIGGIFACLAIIFEYGSILQTQDDETL